MLVDSHAHLQFPELLADIDGVIARAQVAGVSKIICIGTNAEDSRKAVELSKQSDVCWASVGLHPHDAKAGLSELTRIKRLVSEPRVVAIGECGLDYHYNHSAHLEQTKMLHAQIELALSVDKPLIFHVREAFADFWKAVDSYKGLRGVVHSFSSNQKDLDAALARDFYVALNGIMTFTKDADQLAAAKSVPLDKLLLETDAPYLTPAPNRGKVNEPKHIRDITMFLTKLRGEDFEQIAQATTQNATHLFRI